MMKRLLLCAALALTLFSFTYTNPPSADAPVKAVKIPAHAAAKR